MVRREMIKTRRKIKIVVEGLCHFDGGEKCSNFTPKAKTLILL